MKSLAIAASISILLTAAASAAPVAYYANLNGPSESPANPSPGTGFASVVLDTTAHTLFVQISFQDLVSTTTASHIHCCTALPFAGTAGVATQTPTFIGFPTGVTSGSYSHTFDTTLASSWNSPFVTAQGSVGNAEAALAQGLLDGKAYLNIHTQASAGGEIRGFLQPVPEPASFLMAGAALLGLALRRRMRAA